MKRKDFARLATQLQKLETPEALFHLLKTHKQQFNLLCINPPYHVFKVPKQNGELRTIEDPAHELQKIQAALKKYLQALYHCYRTEAAYGYIPQANDEADVRGIYGNALKHLNGAYLLNIDFEDFFHFIHWDDVFSALTRPPFRLHRSVAESICNVSVFEGRLSMGAPTSPPLSNMAVYGFDGEVLAYCKQEGLTYTRYVDDLSFSSAAPVNERQFTQIASFITRHGYEINPKKLRRFGPGETKVITGLEIRDGAVCVPDGFVKEVKAEIENLKAWVLMQTRLFPAGSLEARLIKPLQKLNGALNFMATVAGPDNATVLQLEKTLDEAVQPPTDYESLNWLQIGYEIF